MSKKLSPKEFDLEQKKLNANGNFEAEEVVILGIA